MRRFAFSCLIIALFMGCTTSTTNAQTDWPQWRGPDGTGAASDAITVNSFNPETGENVRWATDLPGPSAATPIVIGDRVFTPACSDATNRLMAMGLDRATGEVLWADEVADGRASRERGRENNHAECSPAADENHVYFMFGSGDLIAYNHDGERQWHLNISETYGEIEILWGYASSPLLIDGKLYIQVVRRPVESYLVCVDAATGEVDWKVDRPSAARDESRESYTTPIAATIDGQTQLVVYGGDALTGHNPATGEELWRFTQDLNPQNQGHFRVIGGPTQGLNGLIYVATPRGEDLFAIAVENNTPALRWMYRGANADVPCPVYHDGSVFILAGQRKTLSRLDAETGEEVWSHRIDTSGYFRCTPTFAGGNIFLITGDGEVFIFSAGETCEQLAQIELGGYPTRATISATHDAVYIRTGNRLYCLGQ